MRAAKTQRRPIYIAELRVINAKSAWQCELEYWRELCAADSDEQLHGGSSDLLREHVVGPDSGLGFRDDVVQPERG
ncbi:MAG: hypothetical protein ACK559_24855, partial [bacterium]